MPLSGLRRTGALALALAACGLNGAQAQTGTLGRVFHAYDNSRYQDVDLVGEAGLIKSNIVYQAQEWADCTVIDKLPRQAAFKAAVAAAADKHPGPIVLDFENIWIKNVDPAKAHLRYRIWRQLFLWAREAAPGRMIGAYDLLGPNTDQYLDCARDLAQYQDGFFPHLYTATTLDQATWERRLDNRVASARNVDSSKPLIPYIRPQYEATCGQNPNPAYLPADRWRRQLDQLGVKAGGFVVWSPVQCSQTVGSNRAWVAETVDFMRDLSAASTAATRDASAWSGTALAPPLLACAPTPGLSAPVRAPQPAPAAVAAEEPDCDELPPL
ncbi:hypothetical protein K4L06_04350 [Lysobacter sp. BMK333-48F3]|uniref:hypothetical protein n=1 Tax=Lysobacter sp. BMK333-48F3 TaxID=2867962 RepID=UPI001C8B6B68|nr:hypothetical protein [Lysobacter sp. BMK333-48F3]MBX9400532.1 hypothetical protein [Lysobacter sp. BMK333-48F3]